MASLSSLIVDPTTIVALIVVGSFFLGCATRIVLHVRARALLRHQAQERAELAANLEAKARENRLSSLVSPSAYVNPLRFKQLANGDVELAEPGRARVRDEDVAHVRPVHRESEQSRVASILHEVKLRGAGQAVDAAAAAEAAAAAARTPRAASQRRWSPASRGSPDDGGSIASSRDAVSFAEFDSSPPKRAWASQRAGGTAPHERAAPSALPLVRRNSAGLIAAALSRFAAPPPPPPPR